MLSIIWWTNALVVGYVYLGYPIILWILDKTKFSKRTNLSHFHDSLPLVSIVIAARNEERNIVSKIENTLSLDYPHDRLGVIIVSDGSTDRTADVLRGYSARGVQLINLSHNVGKACAQNEAVKQAKGEILLFTDANVSLRRDAIRKLVRHFQDDTVGCVVGKVTYLNEGETGVSEGEGFYWRYELFLRHKESYLGNLVAGSGPIIAVRKALYEPLDPAVSEDFFLPMKAAIAGYRTIYDPGAISCERLFQVRPGDMFKTKVRTINLDTRSILLCRDILNPLRYPLYAWGLVSHKLLRWLVPYFLIALFVVNAILLDHSFYQLTMVLQITFYALAVAGYLWQRKGKPSRILGIPFSFCLVNLAALVGVTRFIMGKKMGQWSPVR